MVCAIMGSTTTTEMETKLERSDQTGLTDSTHTSSSSASEKYRLDEFDEAPILLYKYRGGLQTSSQKDLCKWLDKGMFSRKRMSTHNAFDGTTQPSEAYLHDDPRGLRGTAPQRDTINNANTQTVDNNSDRHRVTTKPIPRMTSFVDVLRCDLYLPEEKDTYTTYPNFASSLASVKIPRIPYWSRMFLGNYDQLYIVSPEGSPTSSQASGSTRNTTPTNSWGLDSQLDARLGALREREEGMA